MHKVFGKALIHSLNEKCSEDFILYYLCLDDQTYEALQGYENVRPVRLSELEKDNSRKRKILQSKLNESLRQFNLQASIDTDVPNPEVVGFMIPLMQVKNMIVKAIGGSEQAPEPEIEDEF